MTSDASLDKTEPDSAPDDDLQRWVRLCIAAASEKLASEPKAFYVGDVLGICDWFLVTSGSSERQVRAIVEEIEEQLGAAGGPKPIRIEGKSELSWVLMDYGMLIVHVFTTEAREYYDLERLWSDVPVLSATSDDDGAGASISGRSSQGTTTSTDPNATASTRIRKIS